MSSTSFSFQAYFISPEMSFSLFSKSSCIPSCVTSSARPSVPLGPCGFGGGSGIMGYGGGYGVPAASLGIVPGVIPSGISQLPASEVTVQPPPVQMIIPGAILAASCEPLKVGGSSPCSSGGYGSSGYGLGMGGYLGGGSCGIMGSKQQRPC